MSESEKKIKDAMRIFQALSAVDEELLARSEEADKRQGADWRKTAGRYSGRIHRAGSLMAAVCVAALGIGVWTAGDSIKVHFADHENAKAWMQPEMEGTENAEREGSAAEAYEIMAEGCEAAAEDCEATAGAAAASEMEVAEMEETAEGENTERNEAAWEKGGEIVQKKGVSLTEAEAREIAGLGEYIPASLPTGYEWQEGCGRTEAETGEYSELELIWVKGEARIGLSISFEEQEAESADESSQSVEDTEVCYAPVILWEDLSIEAINTYLRASEDKGSSDALGGSFSVLFDRGVLVSFEGEGTAEEICQMFQSIQAQQ